MVQKHNVDVVILAECAVPPGDVLAALNAAGGGAFCLPPSKGEKVRIFTRLLETNLRDRFNDATGALTVRQLQPPGKADILLAAVHLPSRVNWDVNDQTLNAARLVSDTLQQENLHQHRRTLIVGDLNMNPFDAGVAGAGALHGVMTRDLAQREQREVRGLAFSFFYNPMWGYSGIGRRGRQGRIICKRQSR
jgi:hypothetical protein